MIIKIKNLGILKQAEFVINNLTIICGENNTGKTYATYAVYGFLVFWKELMKINLDRSYIRALIDTGKVEIDINKFIARRSEILEAASKEYSQFLPRVFAAAKNKFANTEFLVQLEQPETCPAQSFSGTYGTAKNEIFKINKSENNNLLEVSLLIKTDADDDIYTDSVKEVIERAIKEILFGHLFPEPFIASTERTGTAIFRKELNFARNRLLEEMSSRDAKFDPFDLLSKVYDDYALPVTKNVEFTRMLETIAKKESFITVDYPEILNEFTDIIGGCYIVSPNDELYYTPAANSRLKLSMDESSSAVRSMLDIGFYLRNIAKKGDILIIDEPELNLHPENQRRLARLFAKLINIGIKVFITTHSDYIIKEFNTLIMLSQKNKYIEDIRLKEGYDERELLKIDNINTYIAKKASILIDGNKRKTPQHTLVKAPATNEFGVELGSFDKTIDDMNRIQEEIIWGED